MVSRIEEQKQKQYLMPYKIKLKIRIMKKLLFITILFLNVVYINAQTTSLECMQGVWKIYRDDELLTFSIKKSHNSLTITYSPNGKYLSISEIIFGFLDFNPNDSGKVYYNDLKQEGLFYVELFKGDMEADSIFKSQYFLTPDFEGCDDEGLYIQARNMIEYNRLERLPSQAMRYLFEEGEKKGYDYISAYLNIKVSQVINSKCTIYSSPGTITQMFLVQGDVPTILEEKEEWLKIEFLGKKLVTGWIKKDDVK
jgi:hypothetical protein